MKRKREKKLVVKWMGPLEKYNEALAHNNIDENSDYSHANEAKEREEIMEREV